METIIIVIAVLLTIVGLLGSVLPVLPGAPLNLAAIILLFFSSNNKAEIGIFALVFFGILTAISLVIDYVLPLERAKAAGASKWGMWGAGIGMIMGFIIFNFLGMIVWMFLGAVIGEIFYGAKFYPAMKSGLGTFIGTLVAILVKLCIAGMMTVYFLWKLAKISLS
jgi:uncharacterized protein